MSAKEGEIVEAKPDKKKKSQEDTPKTVQRMFSMMMQSGGVPPQILDKITPKHIDKVLTLSEKAGRLAYDDKKADRRYAFGYVIAILAVVIILVILLRKDDPTLLTQIITILVSAGGGFGAGWGIGKHSGKKS